MIFRIIPVIFCITSSITAQPAPSETFPHYAYLNSRDENVLLYWKFDDRYITFEMIGNTSGWVGFGISPNGGMRGSDIYVGWVKDGNAYITDRHGLHNGYPPKTEKQDVTLLDGSEENGWTRIKFQRPIAACEVDYDITITTSTLKIIWALGTSDPQGDDITNIDYHGSSRGSRSLFILEATGAGNIQLEGNLEEYLFLNNRTQIPAQDTYYSCTLYKFPELDGKRHIVSFEPVIQEENTLNVHHFLLYACSRDPTNATVLGKTHQCFSRNMPADFKVCDYVMYAWAIGGGTFYLPEHVGYPLGTTDSPRYVMLQTHYDNPDLRSDIVDSSGLKIVYTDQLRENDGAVMQIGHTVHAYSQLIPPNVSSYLIYGECTSNCLAAGMDSAGVSSINVFGTMLHSHLLGRAMTVRHLTDNATTELPYLSQDASYDFNYQEVKVFTKEVTVNLEDSLQVVCNYNSKGKTNFTLAGEATTEEMCLAFLYYYPKIPINRCETFTKSADLYKYFGVEKYRILEPRNFWNATLEKVELLEPKGLPSTLGELVNQMEWDQETGEALSNLVQYLPKMQRCTSPVLLQSVKNSSFAAPNISKPYQPPIPQCTGSSGVISKNSFLLFASIVAVKITTLQA